MSPWFLVRSAYSFQWAANTPPVAKASVTPSAGYSPLTVTFSSARSVDPEGGALMYSWTLAMGPAPLRQSTHQYGHPASRPLRRP